MYLKNTIQLIAVFITLILGACSTTKITNTWKASNAIGKKFNKVLVVGIQDDADVGKKEKMESELVEDLKNAGFNAVASIQQFGPKAFRSTKEDVVVAELQGSGFDAVITIVLLSKEKEKHYVPARVYYSPYVMYHRHFWGYYNTMYTRIYSPGYYVENKRYFWESNLYDLSNKELLYSIQTESYNPGSSIQLAHEYGELIVQDMIKNGVLNK